MHRRPVDSSHVRSVGWDDDVLEVEFRGGQVYRYEGVPERVYQELLGADSVGKHLLREIDGHYEHRRVS